MSQNNVLAHITSRIKADVEFLVAEGLMSRYDADIVSNKLPSVNVDSISSQMARTGLDSPPSSTISTPSSVNPPSTFRKPAPPPPPAAPINVPKIPQAKALWGYNEDGSEPADLSFPPGVTIDLLEETNADWWKGRYNGREGLFPSNYVEKLPASNSSSNNISAPSFPNSGVSPVSSPSPMHGGGGHGARFTAPPPPGGGYMPPPPHNQWGSPSPQPPAPWAQQGPPPPQGGYFTPPPPPEEAQPEKKKSKFSKYGSQAGQAAASGVGFGAGAAIGGGIINSIF